MNLVNTTSMAADIAIAMDPDAQEYLVVLVKGTFAIPNDGGPATRLPAAGQMPIVVADTFTGEPGFSAPVLEADYCLRKPRCDVLLTATAHAPEGRPAVRVPVGVRVGAWCKTFDVIGDRVWEQRGLTPGPGAPAPFLTMPISYDRAFGGVDDSDPARPEASVTNTVGRGFGLVRSAERLLGRPMPNTEDPRDPVRLPWGSYRPMSLGPVARGWQPRLRLAGTYDQHWLDEVFPFLPADFDDRHYQAAPDDQQIDPPVGGEDVVLLNLTPGGGRMAFRLPTASIPVAIERADGGLEHLATTIDTIGIEPDAGRLWLVWRASRPLRRDLFEIAEVLVGGVSRARQIAQAAGKAYHRSIGEAVRAARTRSGRGR
jgi:hypothetical protein